jgi:hypothetical protein
MDCESIKWIIFDPVWHVSHIMTWDVTQYPRVTI